MKTDKAKLKMVLKDLLIGHKIGDNLHKLKPLERKVIILVMLGWTTRNISDHSNYSVSHIKNTRSSAINKLKQVAREKYGVK